MCSFRALTLFSGPIRFDLLARLLSCFHGHSFFDPFCACTRPLDSLRDLLPSWLLEPARLDVAATSLQPGVLSFESGRTFFAGWPTPLLGGGMSLCSVVSSASSAGGFGGSSFELAGAASSPAGRCGLWCSSSSYRPALIDHGVPRIARNSRMYVSHPTRSRTCSLNLWGLFAKGYHLSTVVSL